MKISKTKFYIITILIMLLPISVQWRLFIFGKTTTGKVIHYLQYNQERKKPVSGYSYYPVVEYKVQEKSVRFLCPANLDYDIGKEVKIFYNPNKPHKFVMLNFAGIYLNRKAILPEVTLLLWLAFYFSTKQASWIKKR